MLKFPAVSSPSLNKFELTTSLFLALVSLGMVRLYALGRSGYEISYSDLNNVSGISLFILLLPAIINFIDIARLGKHRSQTIGFSALATLAAIAFIIFCSFLIPFIGYWFLSIVAIIGHVFLAIALFLLVTNSRPAQWLFVIIFAVLLLLWLYGRVYSSYHSPLFFENLSLGLGHMDTLFNASIMQMIKTYGIPSTGLNGTPYLPYHWGSNWLFARFSVFLNTSAITTYNLVYPALFLCLYFKASISLSYDVARQLSGNIHKSMGPGIKFWLFFLVANIGFMPSAFLQNWAVWESWIESESYAISLWFVFLTLSVILFVYNATIVNRSLQTKALLLLIPVLIPLIGLLKVSVLVVVLSGLVYIFIRMGLFRNISYLLIMLATLGLSYYMVKLTASDFIGEQDNFYPFHFMRTYILSSWRGLFYYVHYFWAIIYIIFRLKQANAFTYKSLQTAFHTNSLLDVEALIVIALVGFIPGTLLRIGGGSAYYFTDVQARLAIPLVLSFVLINSIPSLGKQADTFSLTNYLKRYALVIPMILFLLLTNIFSKFEDAVNINLANRINHVSSYAGSKGYLQNATPDIIAFISGNKSAIKDKLIDLRNVPFIGIQENPRYLLYKNLAELDKLDREDKQNKMIYVPRTSTWFWTESFSNPITTPFIIPALTGIKSVGGLPATFDFNFILAYGYQTYTTSLENNDYKSLSVDSVCNYGLQKNILAKEILLIEPEQNKISTLPCKP
ncbi:hypothetical protein GXP67_20355 [Rhodocytophaga rosea]|uniref:Uncharacterized protein n=1 Tax=Rhodocytophaga rosea TaxID=2704465 RepID=A0A6C0GMI1_9BACT|nr:hypothetical protein [Rhodocytophaga rosea]QHT68833.1 hypothetical protein GXP67_20355 [Rhodocytophaga rosea]